MSCCSSRSEIPATALGTAPAASPAAEAAASPPSPASLASFDILSIRQIARLHAGEQIIVSPISWTGRHVELLGCSFEEPVPASSKPGEQCPQAYDGSVYAKAYLRNWWRYGCRLHNIQGLLAAPECPLRLRSGVTLRFDRLNKKLKCALFYQRNRESIGKAPDGPLAAYTDLGFVESLRKDTLRCYTTARHNPPGHAVWLRKWNKLKPSEPLHDPYIVALLIAVAQLRRQHVNKASSSRQVQEQFFSSRVVCSLKSEKVLYVYTADVSSFLLDMFDDSSALPPTPIFTSIKIQEVTISPPQTLRARLLAILCPAQAADCRTRKLEGDATSLRLPLETGRLDRDYLGTLDPLQD